MSKRWGRRAAGTALLAAAIMAAGTGCGNDDSTTPQTTPVATSSATATPPPVAPVPPAAEPSAQPEAPTEAPALEEEPATITEAPAEQEPAPAYTEDVEPPPSSDGVVTVGEPCSSPSVIGTDINTGADIVCVYTGGGGNVWVSSAPIAGVNSPGDNCDSSTDKVSRTPEGKAIMCVQGTWVYGP